MNFKELNLNDKVFRALTTAGYTMPTPIQEKAIPYILERKDLLGCAQTGTGKTAAFALPIISNLLENQNKDFDRKIKVLILTPTRELAIQIRDNFRAYGMYTNLKCSVILGGVNQKSQIEVLKKGVDILVATPGRLLDLINQKYVKLENVSTFVLDEADTMLDMGFVKDVNKIIKCLPQDKQTLFFSATMPKEISELAATILNDYAVVEVAPVSSTASKIAQMVYYVDRENKVKLLLDILNDEEIKSMLIFTRTKHGANKLSETLEIRGIHSGVIHGNKSQSARVSALNNFKSGNTKVLIATDIAARGIDINELSHVVNYDM
ncbi:MAG: DEAD/DEAH box helicase, partial [Bacilli bacterium]|nr:DEAD/DEAH box helicase [Bacilli bacterium]